MLDFTLVSEDELAKNVDVDAWSVAGCGDNCCMCNAECKQLPTLQDRLNGRQETFGLVDWRPSLF